MSVYIGPCVYVCVYMCAYVYVRIIILANIISGVHHQMTSIVILALHWPIGGIPWRASLKISRLFKNLLRENKTQIRTAFFNDL